MVRCEDLVTCRDLRLPHHLDTHAREDHANSTDCVDPHPADTMDCWQCLPENKPMYEDIEPNAQFL